MYSCRPWGLNPSVRAECRSPTHGGPPALIPAAVQQERRRKAWVQAGQVRRHYLRLSFSWFVVTGLWEQTLSKCNPMSLHPSLAAGRVPAVPGTTLARLLLTLVWPPARRQRRLAQGRIVIAVHAVAPRLHVLSLSLPPPSNPLRSTGFGGFDLRSLSQGSQDPRSCTTVFRFCANSWRPGEGPSEAQTRATAALLPPACFCAPHARSSCLLGKS